MKILSLSLLLSLSVLLVACGGETATAEATETETEVAPVAEEPAVSGLQIGDVAPDFLLEGIDGEMHSLASTMDANGETPKGYIVTFTCNTCPYAKGYEERLVALHEKMSPMGYPVVAIQPNDVTIKPGDNMEAMQARAAEKGFGFAYLLDAEQTIFPQYGATKTPEIYLLDANRVLQYHGAIDDSAQDAEGVTERYVEMAVAALEAGQMPEPTEVKAIGCSIKAK
ncbi:thioredoxin family protein [Lewinella sp. W8]|uniref:thioredoxin family protein n=1 Tax=Lewinella sp. W8 TaxID=2528208 RepID=UPI001067B06C|nr:thioredoxin family protein [Lewinella sp. W8]MTB52818.1 redoxin domain-containing protein [Lewinella sp. W8]